MTVEREHQKNAKEVMTLLARLYTLQQQTTNLLQSKEGKTRKNVEKVEIALHRFGCANNKIQSSDSEVRKKKK